MHSGFALPDLDVEGLPAPAAALAAEQILLDPGWASEISRLVGGEVDLEALQTRQRMIWGDYHEAHVTVAAMTAAAGFIGVRPSPHSVEAWAQPWAPLYLCWRVSWYPTTYPEAGDPDQSLPDWRFDGLDHEWTGVGGFDTERAVNLQGRTLLHATGTRALQRNLEALYEFEGAGDLNAADRQWLETLRNHLESADLLSQSLAGFHDQLIQRDPLQYYDPPAEIRELLGDVERQAPVPFLNGASASHFYPVRAGHFRLRRLWIVDAFGQVFDPIKERGQTPESFTPLRGSGLRTVGLSQRRDTQMLQLPPRVVQACRLQFRFVAPGGGDAGATANPVCGWLLPNHYDKSLTVYDTAGRALGAVLLTGGGESNRQTRWEPALGGQNSTAVEDIDNEHLRLLVQGLLEKQNPAAAFEDLVEVIDRTLWTIDPLGKRGDNLSVMIGRPIAVVRAQLSLELEADPVTDQLWQNTLVGADDPPPAFADFELPLQLGHAELPDDGTLGFFTEREYGRFHAVHDLDRDHEDYVIRPGTDRLAVRARGDETRITLLVDPRGSVHARCGFVPTKSIRLPRRFVDRPLERMDVTFRVGPFLDQPQGLRMPLPAEIQGGWSWIQKSGVDLFAEEVTEITPATHQAQLTSTPIHIRDGWLKLSDALGGGGEDR